MGLPRSGTPHSGIPTDKPTDVPDIRKQIVMLSAKRKELEKELLLFRHPMMKGSLYLQYTRCNKAGCRCNRGEKHGPFHYLSVKKEGRTVIRYMGKNVDPDAEKKLSRYLAFSKKLHALRKCDRALTELWNQFKEELTDEKKDGKRSDA